MKEPLKDAVSQLTSLMADFSKDATEQGMLALGNAVKIIPVAGNIISAVDLVNNVEKLSSKAVESANKTLDIASDVEFNTSIGLKKQEIEKMEGTEDQINEKIQILNDFLTEEMKKSQKEIDDLNKQINDKTGDEDTIKNEIYNLETKNKEIEGQKMDRRRPSPASNVETVSQKGGAKMIKAHINTSKQTLKRVNKCLKDHFNKCVTRKSPYSASKKKRDKRIVNKTAKKI
jgi:septal ring factor EnvC (AmiA/AmiB activator)